jgi:Transposase zinc-binding domain
MRPLKAPGGSSIHYERHRLEPTTLYRLVQQHAATFFAQVGTATGRALPKFVKDEFAAFPECGILAHGFLRLRCGDCAHDKLVAFSCKRRGFCPSCVARRMSETAAHLVDHVIPQVPVRHWVISRHLLEQPDAEATASGFVCLSNCLRPMGRPEGVDVAGRSAQRISGQQKLCAKLQGFSLHASISSRRR